LTVEGSLELSKTISGFEGDGWLVRALINEPKLLLFDEVTVGFDSESLKVITGVLGDLAGREQRP
jgi:ABC-type molybdenum transport system ATPase subunit/photorepair protein PhrA